jgi:hypothetical protein
LENDEKRKQAGVALCQAQFNLQGAKEAVVPYTVCSKEEVKESVLI